MIADLSETHRRLLLDAGTALGTFLLLVVPLIALGIPEEAAVIGWSTLMVASLAFRRVNPLLAVVVCAVAGTGMVLQVPSPVPAMLVVLVIVFSASRHLSATAGLVVIPLGVAASILGPLSWLGRIPEGQRFLAGGLLSLLCLSLMINAYLLGRRVAVQNHVTRLDEALAEERFLAGARSAQDATELAEDRARTEVARELHDVVAHSLSVIVVQAEGAKALATKKPEAAVEALNVIARTGRSSIGEMRRIVSLLRGESDASFGPSPSLPQIPEMVAKAGPRITLEMPEELPPVPESLGLTAFRVVQESVTNFLKHAGPTARATATITCELEAIDIRVTDDGVGVQAPTEGRGAGVRGMRERVAAMGGTFKAGPRTGGGYEVRARLPLPSQLGRGWLK
ncbi:sensor histidine kinase [Arachnia propionica]|uniref:sensor histidine kinase n=1 Tax=Arachnia propionica TaxID=1750 RepID=UPI00242A4525|nr:sensor histidine kinase [Arachnia propionica]